ncbi:MAG: AAA family ATPase [Deferribacteraceae bacterium]|nr:AAA family ATPase [Deferribacteraceae bacterium]
MIQKISIKNYRNISVENLELGKINVLIGPNGSGKSNFLKAMSFWVQIIMLYSYIFYLSPYLHKKSFYHFQGYIQNN